jgi:thioredoxin-like negative regulator of GroEL
VDAASEVAKQYEVMSMPTFLFIKGGQVVARFSGASVEKLRSVIETYI